MVQANAADWCRFPHIGSKWQACLLYSITVVCHDVYEIFSHHWSWSFDVVTWWHELKKVHIIVLLIMLTVGSDSKIVLEWIQSCMWSYYLVTILQVKCICFIVSVTPCRCRSLMRLRNIVAFGAASQKTGHTTYMYVRNFAKC